MSMEAKLERINNLLSHLHTEITALEHRRFEVLEALRKREQEKKRPKSPSFRLQDDWKKGATFLFEKAKTANRNAAIINIKIDLFDRVSLIQGEKTAERVSEAVGRVLKDFENKDCLIFQSSKSEFVMVQVGSEAEVLAFSESMRRKIERLHGPAIEPDGEYSMVVHWRCTASLGMSMANRCGYQLEKAVALAKDALEKAVKKGRNRVQAA